MAVRNQNGNGLLKLSWANICFLILIFACGSWIAERSAITTFIGYIPQLPYLVPSFPLLLIAILKKHRKATFVNVGALIIFGWLLLGVNWPHRLKIADEGPSFTLMTFNAKNATLGWPKILTVVQEHQPDIICFQEGNEMGDLPGYDIRFFSGKLIASKVPIVDSKNFVLT